MEELEKLLEKNNIDYKSLEKFLCSKNDNILYKIMHNIRKLNNTTQKQVCEYIIVNTHNKDLIETTCSQISIFVSFDYDFYKKILKLIISKNIKEHVIEELGNDILQNSPEALQDVFLDFSLKCPNNIDYDLSIIQCFLDNYTEYSTILKNITINKSQSLKICKRLNYILTIRLSEILDLYFYFNSTFNFTKAEISTFLDTFIFNFPSICKNFIKSRNAQTDNTLFITYLTNKIKANNSENELKNNIKIYNYDVQRLNEYKKYLVMQNNEINDKSREMSAFLNLFKTSTILYSNRYGITIKHKDSEELSICNMHEFSYEYPLPLEYIIDPITYMEKVNEIKNLGKEEK